MELNQFMCKIWNHSNTGRVVVLFLLSVIMTQLSACCACTQKRCSDEVVFVNLTDTTGTDFERCESLLIRWTSDGVNGEVAESEIRNGKRVFQIPGRQDFEDGDIVVVGTKALSIDLYCDDIGLLSSEFSLKWDEFVCNECGKYSWCEDETASTASIDIDIDSTQFPAN